MARLRNPRSGVVVDVDDATAARLRTAGYVSVETDKPAKKAPSRRKSPAKSEDD